MRKIVCVVVPLLAVAAVSVNLYGAPSSALPINKVQLVNSSQLVPLQKKKQTPPKKKLPTGNQTTANQTKPIGPGIRVNITLGELEGFYKPNTPNRANRINEINRFTFTFRGGINRYEPLVRP